MKCFYCAAYFLACRSIFILDSLWITSQHWMLTLGQINKNIYLRFDGTSHFLQCSCLSPLPSSTHRHSTWTIIISVRPSQFIDHLYASWTLLVGAPKLSHSDRIIWGDTFARRDGSYNENKLHAYIFLWVNFFYSSLSWIWNQIKMYFV